MPTLTETARELFALLEQAEAYEKESAAEILRLRREIADRKNILNQAEAGLDPEKIALAETVLQVRGEYARAGEDRASARQDAIRQLSTGKAENAYKDLWSNYLGTKNYDRWHGQRCDCSYGMGPRHGSIIFSIGLTDETRRRDPRELSAEETEAAIYYLFNLERIQEARKAAQAA